MYALPHCVSPKSKNNCNLRKMYFTEFDVRYLNVKCYYLTIGWTLLAETRVVALNMTSHWTFLNIFCDSLVFTCISKLLATWNLKKKEYYIYPQYTFYELIIWFNKKINTCTSIYYINSLDLIIKNKWSHRFKMDQQNNNKFAFF